MTDASGRSVNRVVVVSAGAINSTALLLASADARNPDGLANSSGQLGRNLMLHNNSSLIAISKEPNPTVFHKTLGINDCYFDGDGWDYPLGADGQINFAYTPTDLEAHQRLRDRFVSQSR